MRDLGQKRNLDDDRPSRSGKRPRDGPDRAREKARLDVHTRILPTVHRSPGSDPPFAQETPGGVKPTLRNSPRWIWLLPILTCATALLVQFQSVVFSGFRLTHGGLGDARLVNYTLEHGYRAVRGITPNEKFWDPPLFYPWENVSAYTYLMVGFGPMYWIWRWAGAPVDTSFQLWILTVYVLNFTAAFGLMRIGLRTGRMAATFGALFFSVSAVRFISHPQMFPLFYVLLGFTALLRAFDSTKAGPTPGLRRVWISLFFATAVAQAWAAVYSFFFFGLLCLLAGTIASVQPEFRKKLLGRLLGNWKWWAGSALAGTILLAPLLHHYGLTASELGYRDYRSSSIPRPLSWFLLGSNHWLYQWIQPRNGELSGSPFKKGSGFVAIAVALFGLFKYRAQPSIKTIAGATLLFALLATWYGGFSPWRLVYTLVPGANGLRALDRATIVLLPFVAIGVTLACEQLSTRRRWLVSIPILVLVIGEAACSMGCIDKLRIREHMARVIDLVDPDSEAFFLVGLDREGAWIAEDASWASLATGKPTVNGRYGNSPAYYYLPSLPALGSPGPVGRSISREYLQAALGTWVEANALSPNRVQWIEYQPMTKAWRHQDTREKRRLEKQKNGNQRLEKRRLRRERRQRRDPGWSD